MSAIFSPGNSPADPNHLDWKVALADAVTDPAEFCRRLELPAPAAQGAARAARAFSILVPRTFLARIRAGDPGDPLLAQVLPTEAELTRVAEFTADPVGEADAVDASGLLRKYANRSLILTTAACGVHCRFCFRRHFAFPVSPNADQVRNQKGLAKIRARRAEVATQNSNLPGCPDSALQRIAADPSLHEVILSGGDPLTLDDETLNELVLQVSRIPHIRRIRLHTRLPILIPQRVTDGLLACLAGGSLPSFLVVHLNHPAEIDGHVAHALGRLVDAGVPVLSQSVLLRGVNDQLDTLADLFERLVDLRVIPYYLHQLDRVAGAAHFEVPEETGIQLIRQLRAQLPGYAVPRYVREVVGEPNKVVLA
jgi:KamA family protein